MKQTKEQLNKLSNEFEIRLKQKIEADELLRKEFAKAFNWWKKAAYDYGERDPICPTWEQIFVEVGKLLAARTFYDEVVICRKCGEIRKTNIIYPPI